MEKQKIENNRMEGRNTPLKEYLDRLLTYQEKENKSDINNKIKTYPTLNIKSDINIEKCKI